jgi:hypothetical protein
VTSRELAESDIPALQTARRKFMEKNENTESQLRNQLKLLLYYFAKESDQPGRELQVMLREVITELYEEISAANESKKGLRLVVTNPQ